MKALFWCRTGPLMRYAGGALEIEDLNPEVFVKWRMSRWEMFQIGVRFIVVALTARDTDTGDLATPPATNETGK